ncbi:MAG: 16S rRNA (uracil(1498)-N(3))-methyltransferase, partial [Bacteroidota bacterium]
ATPRDALDLAGGLVFVGFDDGDQCLAVAERVRTARRMVVVIGPEGGLSERELNVLRNDAAARLWRIGSLRLRAETAAVAMASVVRSML